MRSDKDVGPRQNGRLQALDAVELTAVGQAARGVDRLALFHAAPAPDGVVGLQGKAHRVHQLVAARAGRILAMLGQPLAHREAANRHAVFLQRRHVGGRRRRRHAQNVVQYPLAANHRRGAGGVGGHRQDAGVPQQPAAPGILI
jgi:hypothetical protein